MAIAYFNLSEGSAMKISHLLPTWLRSILRPYASRIWVLGWRLRLQWWKLTRDSRVRRYYRAHRVIKISLGAGDHTRTGWLNTDNEPLKREIVFVDVTKRFPFPEQSVDYFHTEHMIEHLPLSSAQFVINECYRTLKPGGKIRIATPDIMKLARLMLDPDDAVVVGYATWALRQFPPALEPSTVLTPCMVFNNYIRTSIHIRPRDSERPTGESWLCFNKSSADQRKPGSKSCRTGDAPVGDRRCCE
jgi:methyltransferase family protein